MGISGHPAALAPGQSALQLEGQLLRPVHDLDRRANRCDLIPAADLDGDPPQGQIDYALAGDVAVLVGAVDELGVVVLEPVGIHLAVVAARRKVFTGRPMQMETDRHRLPRLLVDDAHLHRPTGRGDRVDAERGFLRSCSLPARKIDCQGQISSSGDMEAPSRMRHILHNHGRSTTC